MNDLQTFARPVDNIQQLIKIDMGFGPPQARFQDVEINDEGEELEEGGQILPS